jgi:hypothetical protein
MNKLYNYNYIILFFFLILLVLWKYVNIYIESFENENNIEIVIARYNEDLEWLKDEPFNKYQYIVYNKGVNKDYFKSEKFKNEVELENVGRETHTYLTHIINNYDNGLANFTLFVPGSLELENRFERAKRLFNEVENNNSDLFACIMYDKPVKDVFNDFQIDNYLSSNQNNRSLNNDSSIKVSDIRPYGKWYENVYNNANSDSKCFTQNSMFGLTKNTILKKPKSYYMDLLNQVNEHNNHESVHYFERSWETVFFPYSDVKYVY